MTHGGKVFTFDGWMCDDDDVILTLFGWGEFEFRKKKEVRGFVDVIANK